MTSSEKVAEAAMDSFWCHYEAGDFDAGIALLKGFGHRKNAVDFVLSPDNYYIPNLRGTELKRPTSVSDEKIPVMALEPGVTYTFERPYLHDLQRVGLMMAGYSDQGIAGIDASFRRLQNEQIEITPKTGGKNTFTLLRSDDTAGKNIQCRPGLVINASGEAGKLADEHAEVVLHEVVHLAQGLSNPVYPDELSHRFAKEFQAYAVQATLARSWNMPYSPSSHKAGAVDLARKRYMGESEYVPKPLRVGYATSRRGYCSVGCAISAKQNY